MSAGGGGGGSANHGNQSLEEEKRRQKNDRDVQMCAPNDALTGENRVPGQLVGGRRTRSPPDNYHLGGKGVLKKRQK